MGPLDQFASADLSASKAIVQRYLERGFVKPALARLQLCLSIGSNDDEVLELLAEAFEKLGKTEKAEYVQRILARRRRAQTASWDDDPTSIHIDVSTFGDASAWDDMPTNEWQRRGTEYVKIAPVM